MSEKRIQSFPHSKSCFCGLQRSSYKNTGEMVSATHFSNSFSPSHTQHFEDLLPAWFSSVQSLCRVWLFATQWTALHQASLSMTNPQSLLKLMSVESVMPSNHLILCRPLLLLPSIFPSISVFSNESAPCIRWPKYWSFNFSIGPSSEYSGLISFKMDWLDLLAVQGTLRSLLQHHSSKASILRHSGSLWPKSHIHTWLPWKNHSFD